MLFMVIEDFKDADLNHVGERFKRCGRMLPEGVLYVASWMEARGARCNQLMEALDRAALDSWIGRWSDLVSFEVEEVLASADFWSKREPGE